MTRTLSMLSAVLMVLVAAAATQAQTRPDPADVAARCVATMQQTTDRVVGAIGGTTSAVLDRIADLDASGASDDEIIAAGRRGISRVTGLARMGVARVSRTERRCIGVLRRLGADRALIGRVADAADGFREDIGNAASRGVGAIRQAVDDATGGG
ncbi:MAG: hypothetical protein AAFX79_09090 [Planctomycetota bacterium]